jgi:LmbE family N-acetylglucosaminyl deacetylase
MRILLVSPHPDDIAWSLGATVRRLPAPHVLTLFSETLYAPASPSHGTAEASAVRAAEENAWAELVGATVHRRGLPDASLRGYDDVTEMGATPTEDIVRTVTDLVRAEIAAVEPELVLAPLAVGGHVDHEAVRLAVAACGGPEVLWYEDLPYAGGTAPRPTGHPVTVSVTGRWPAVEAGVRCYPSQQPDTILPVIRRHHATNAGERLWAESASSATRFGRLVS